MGEVWQKVLSSICEPPPFPPHSSYLLARSLTSTTSSSCPESKIVLRPQGAYPSPYTCPPDLSPASRDDPPASPLASCQLPNWPLHPVTTCRQSGNDFYDEPYQNKVESCVFQPRGSYPSPHTCTPDVSAASRDPQLLLCFPDWTRHPVTYTRPER